MLLITARPAGLIWEMWVETLVNWGGAAPRPLPEGNPSRLLFRTSLDRLANASYQIVIEGASYRERLSPHRALLDRKEVVDPQT